MLGTKMFELMGENTPIVPPSNATIHLVPGENAL
jgi:hypothetical protein